MKFFKFITIIRVCIYIHNRPSFYFITQRKPLQNIDHYLRYVSTDLCYNPGFSSPFEDDVLSSTRFSSEQVDLMFSLISIGAILGCFIAGLWSSRYGRRAALICNTIPYIVGSLLMIAGTGSYDLLCVGRLLCGTGVGMSSVLVPLYIAEIASSEMRGSLGAASSVALSLGLILVNCAGLPAVTYPGFWRITLLGTIAMAVVMGVLLITIGVETPRFLLSTGRQEDALHSLRKLRGPSADVEAELHELLDYEEVGVGSLSNDNEPWESTYRRYFASDEVDLNQEPGYSTMAVHFANTPTHSPKALELPSPRLHTQHHQEGTEQIPGPPKPSFFQLVRMKENFVPLLLGVSLQLLQQFSGINAFMFHTKAMLSSSTNYSDDHDSTEMAANNHLDEAAAYIALFGAIGVNTLQLAVGLIAVAIIEKAGRRFWLMFSCFGMGIFSFLLGYVIEVDAPSYAKLLIIMGYVAMFALGVGPIPWLICSEIFPSAIRSNAVAIATTANWMGAFLITASFPFLQRVLGEAQVFWLYGGVVTLGAVYVYFFLPETSGLTLEEIELLFAQQKIAQDVNAPIPF